MTSSLSGKEPKALQHMTPQADGPACPRGRWVEVVSHVAPRYGGVATAVSQMSQTLSALQGFQIDMASFTATDESGDLLLPPAMSFTHWPAAASAWCFATQLRARLRQFFAEADGLHLHGIWETHTVVAARMAQSMRKPYIVSAHGMLDPWALRNKAWKKRVYALLVERSNLRQAACLHALTAAEAEDYRHFGCRQPIAIIPNAVQLPRSVDPSLFLDRFPGLEHRRIVLFLGRLHFKKGLDILVQAWSEVQAAHTDAVLVLAGPDAEDSRAPIERMIESLGLSNRVVFTGMLDATMKWSALANASAFVLPSYSEGLSMAVLEAMGMGVPVIVSRECHVPEVESFGAGWQIAPKVHDLTDALSAMLRTTAARNAEIGNRGKHLVRERFSARTVTQQMAHLYSWVQGGPRPTSFELQEVRA